MSGAAIMLAAGGTGGHLFPAMALAEELARRGWAVDLVTDMRGDRYGTGFPARAMYQVPSATLAGRSPFATVKALAAIVRGVWAAVKLMREVRPAAIAGFGGYPSLPPLIAARLCAVPALVHEQNAVMGRANRVLQRLAGVIALSFETTRHVPESAKARTRVTGNPVRDAVIAAGHKAYRAPGKADEFRLLVFGGSQGARYFSDSVPEAVRLLSPPMRRRLRIVQQCRGEDLERVRAAYGAAGIEAELATFFSDLPARAANSHLVIARSGASTVAELGVLGRPAILVPYSYALDNDQRENATRLEQSGGAWCLPERELTPARLAKELERLIADPRLLADAAKAIRTCGRPDAVARLADEVERIARGAGERERVSHADAS